MYPERLLPSKYRVESFNYCTDNDWICRRSSIEKSLMYDDEGDLEDANIKIEDIIDCSTNLINSESTSNVVETVPSDVLISVDGDYKKLALSEWNDQDHDVPEAKDITCSLDSDKGYFLIPICKVHDVEDEFPFDKKNNGKEAIFKFEVKVEYKPTMMNVSHFEIHLYSDFDGQMKKVKRGKVKSGTYRHEICHIVKELVRKNWKSEL